MIARFLYPATAGAHVEPDTPPPEWLEGQVAQAIDDDRVLLCDGRVAVRALSCVIAPQALDHVLLLQAARTLFVAHVLAREGRQARLTLPGVDGLVIAQPTIDVRTTERLALRSLADVEITSANGSVSLSAIDVVTHAAGALVQNARHVVTHAQHCVLQVAALLRVHGRQALITSEEDMKLDAQRISLG